MMVHPDIERFLVTERVETLRRDAGHTPRRAVETHVPEAPSDVELRLCRVCDNEALSDLAALNERELPKGSFVLAFVEGRLVAAHSLDGGGVLADPFAPTADLRKLLALRAAQIQEPTPSRRFGRLRRATV